MACSSCKKKKMQTSTVKKKSISQPPSPKLEESAIVEIEGKLYKIVSTK